MSKAIEIQSPNHLKIKRGYTSVFLGGSIEMGKAVDYQKEVITALQDKEVIFLNWVFMLSQKNLLCVVQKVFGERVMLISYVRNMMLNKWNL